MRLSVEEMRAIHQIQLQILKSFLRVCETINLQYYFIHGSLLGTIKHGGFFPFDDDIDVAMPRKDYDRLITEGQKYISKDFFIQSCDTESDYPLPFAKIRANGTTFRQPLMDKLNIHQGIYIDIFPIDNYPKNAFRQLCIKFKEMVYSVRISERYSFKEQQPFWKKTLRRISKWVVTDWYKAVHMRSRLYADEPICGTGIIIGGKNSERGIPLAWFAKGQELQFERIPVSCPCMIDEYLKCIYGDYIRFDPSSEYMNPDNTVTVSAESVCISE